MALGNSDIAELIRSGTLVVSPLTQQHIQCAGIQLSLGAKLARMKPGQRIDPASGIAPEWTVFDIDPETGYDFKPGEFLLGHTGEALAIPNTMLAMVDGRSTAARLGVVPHMAAMAIWPGHGYGKVGPSPRAITLELKNQGDATIVLRPGWFVANLTLHMLKTAVTISYDAAKHSRYGSDTALMLPRLNGELLDTSRFIEDPAVFELDSPKAA